MLPCRGQQEVKGMGLAILEYGCVFVALMIFFNLHSTSATLTTTPISYAIANNSWLNNQESALHSYCFVDGSRFRAILVRNKNSRNSSNSHPKFGFGFFRNSTDEISYLVTLRFFGKIVLPPDYHNHPPVIYWFANGNFPVKENGTLEFTADGDLILKDVDGGAVWSTETSGSKATRLSLDGNGNLKLFDANRQAHWTSFLHPTNTWIPGQGMNVRYKLTSTNSTTNFSNGMFFFIPSPEGIQLFLNLSTAEKYQTIPYEKSFPQGLVFNHSGNHVTYDAPRTKFHYIRLEPNGHLNLYELENGYSDNIDLSRDDYYGDCIYPMECGTYGLCSNNTCTCPGNSRYFKQSNDNNNHFSCAEVTPLSCQSKHPQEFLKLEKVTYFDFVPHLINTDVETCKRACMLNCSCKAALFRSQGSLSTGNCSLPTEVYTLRNTTRANSGYNDITFIKVQMPLHKQSQLLILLWSVSAILLLIMGASVYFFKRWWDRQRRDCCTAESSIHVANHLVPFSLKVMKSATRDFAVRLGRGGSGSVFEGFLDDGTKVAVKCLYPGENRGKKEFLSEVNTIGNIHHFNLARLIGYCAEKSNRLLVYEYMCNGSLDKWIYHKKRTQILTWETRKKIIVQIARGLEYLHDHCNPKIIHFDIKPQNILLDTDLNVKISDFGLARLIDKDQSHVSTMPKGTPGYMAPELTSGNIVTPKIDIYSFGVVILEIICGRRSSNAKSGDYLIDTLKIKAEAGELSDLVDPQSEDMQRHKHDAVKLIQIAISCLHKHLFRRPSASMLVKILEGASNLETVADYNFLNFAVKETLGEPKPNSPSPATASTLSGPR